MSENTLACTAAEFAVAKAEYERLIEERRKEVRQLHADGHTDGAIAKLYGVDRTRVLRIRAGRE